MRSGARGFTLIELLVVIAIIGVLSSVVLASLNGARKKGRDARRMSDVKQLKLALELYYNDNNQYPSVAAPNVGALITALAPALTPTHIRTIPQDPSFAGVVTVNEGDYQYVRGTANQYGLWVYMEEAHGSVPVGRCISGEGINPLWFTGPPACPF